MNSKAPAICIRDSYLAYDGMVLFDHLNLTISAGKITCLLGPSGVGKTTLLQMIAGISPQHKEQFIGEITADNGQPLQSQIAYLAQNDSLLPWLTALDNALLGSHLRYDLTQTRVERAHDFFKKMGMSTAETKYPRQLSGGMRQRVALIRTLLEEKPIVLMDEPFSALDAITRFQLQTLSSELLQDKTVFLITHDPLEALRMADEIYILAGQPAHIQETIILSTATPRDIDNPEVLRNQAVLFHALTKAQEQFL